MTTQEEKLAVCAQYRKCQFNTVREEADHLAILGQLVDQLDEASYSGLVLALARGSERRKVGRPKTTDPSPCVFFPVIGQKTPRLTYNKRLVSVTVFLCKYFRNVPYAGGPRIPNAPCKLTKGRHPADAGQICVNPFHLVIVKGGRETKSATENYSPSADRTKNRNVGRKGKHVKDGGWIVSQPRDWRATLKTFGTETTESWRPNDGSSMSYNCSYRLKTTTSRHADGLVRQLRHDAHQPDEHGAKVCCSDGQLSVSRFLLGLVFPELLTCDLFQLPLDHTLLLPHHTSAEISNMIDRLLGGKGELVTIHNSEGFVGYLNPNSIEARCQQQNERQFRDKKKKGRPSKTLKKQKNIVRVKCTKCNVLFRGYLLYEHHPCRMEEENRSVVGNFITCKCCGAHFETILQLCGHVSSRNLKFNYSECFKFYYQRRKNCVVIKPRMYKKKDPKMAVIDSKASMDSQKYSNFTLSLPDIKKFITSRPEPGLLSINRQCLAAIADQDRDHTTSTSRGNLLKEEPMDIRSMNNVVGELSDPLSIHPSDEPVVGIENGDEDWGEMEAYGTGREEEFGTFHLGTAEFDSEESPYNKVDELLDDCVQDADNNDDEPADATTSADNESIVISSCASLISKTRNSRQQQTAILFDEGLELTHECQECGGFMTAHAFREHVNSCRGKYYCDLCDRQFPNNFTLKKHDEIMHSGHEEDEVGAVGNVPGVKQESNCVPAGLQIEERKEEKVGHVCLGCGKSFGLRIALKMHHSLSSECKRTTERLERDEECEVVGGSSSIVANSTDPLEPRPVKLEEPIQPPADPAPVVVKQEVEAGSAAEVSGVNSVDEDNDCVIIVEEVSPSPAPDKHTQNSGPELFEAYEFQRIPMGMSKVKIDEFFAGRRVKLEEMYLVESSLLFHTIRVRVRESCAKRLDKLDIRPEGSIRVKINLDEFRPKQ